MSGGHYALDAHTLIWLLEGNDKLSPSARERLLNPGAVLLISVSALAEACWMIEKERAAILMQPFRETITGDRRVIIDPVDEDLVFQSTAGIYGGLKDMHDRPIVASALRATAQYPDLSLISADAEITASGLVPVTW